MGIQPGETLKPVHSDPLGVGDRVDRRQLDSEGKSVVQQILIEHSLCGSYWRYNHIEGGLRF